ncbi:MAG: benzoyl-CoA 2,3-epoxidase subunit BoxB [Alphaproteobacteria bacterium]|nr:benzoyl-CoA 2,3-epoxidase subunit BoxB [Alphaproteobacteria bacterium]
MQHVDNDALIPNNVGLADDRRLLRALEHWQPAYLRWWQELGPDGALAHEVYLRTAISVETSGWAHYDFVRMPEYRWGIFLAPAEANRVIPFGRHKGEPVWQDVPGEYRTELRRLIVTQGDTEPASVEQQRHLGATCPSLYDLRNLYQVNVEEGRHLWAMVYLLHAHFGRDGREEAEAMLSRHAGDPDKPRILQAFNEPTTDWLSFFMFTFFQDRDGKYQLAALAESGFDPLARSCRFMLTEEAHHMFVGESGVMRVVQRACEKVDEHKTADIRPYGGIDLDTIQKWINFHYSICLDLFGQEESTNAANYYSMGLKGRFQETRIGDDHVLADAVAHVPALDGERLVEREVTALKAMNETLRSAYVEDSQRGIDRFNKIIRDHGIDVTLRLPHRAFHRNIGAFAGVKATPEGKLISAEEWNRRRGDWLPTEADRAFVSSLMRPVREAGRMADWIAPPKRGIHGKPVEFEYVRFH